MKFRRLFADIVCGFIPSKQARSKVRTILRYPSSRGYIKWVRNWAKKNAGGVKKLKVAFGVGCKNLVVILNDEHVFKFALTTNGAAAAIREKRIMDAFRKITPIPMPEMELIDWRGITIRRQDFMKGKLLGDFEPSYVLKNRTKIATQLANFLHVIGTADPKEIADLKPKNAKKSGYLYGWFHNDIGQNFMMDDQLNIIGFIDWENTEFCDWKTTLYGAERHWDKNGYRGLMVDVMSEYSKMFYAGSKKAK